MQDADARFTVGDECLTVARMGALFQIDQLRIKRQPRLGGWNGLDVDPHHRAGIRYCIHGNFYVPVYDFFTLTEGYLLNNCAVATPSCVCNRTKTLRTESHEKIDTKSR